MKAGHFSFLYRGFLLTVTTAFLFLCGLLPQAQAQSGPDTVYQFVYAIYQNDTNTALQLLESNTNLAGCKYGGDMGGSILPLLEAAAAGNIGLVKRLLELGVDVNAEGRVWSGGSRMTALDEAVQHRRLDVCELLLKAGANPNHWSFQETTLHLAFENLFYNSASNRNAIATALLEHGADPFAEAGYYKTTPFELAISRGDGRLVPLMLDTGRKIAPTKSPRNSPRSKATSPEEKISQILADRGLMLLTTAAQRGELEAVEALLKAGVSARTNVPTELPVLQVFALAAAEAAKSRADAIKQLEETRQRLKEFDANANSGFVASMRAQEAAQAAKVGDMAPDRWLKIRDLLIKNGADYDAFAATALGDKLQAEKILSADKNAVFARNCAGETPLHWAVKTDRLPFALFWIQSGASTATTNFAGQTALHLAAVDGKIEFVKALLAAKSPTDTRDTNGWTPLDAAIQAKQSIAIRLLMADKSAPAHPERGITTPLHKAAANGDIATLAVLLETATHLEARNELGLTPLQVAVTQGHLAAAAMLVDKGADITLRDADGNTLLHQIFLQDRFSVRDRPPTNWLASLKDSPHKGEFIRYLTVGQYEQGPNEILQGTSFLLACGVDAAATNRAGDTVMQLVTGEKTSRSVFFFDEDQSKLFKLLGDGGGKLDERDADGNTALHRIVNGIGGGENDQAAALIKAGANVNATNNLGQTPLHKAAEKIWGWSDNIPPTEQFRLLVLNKANVNAQDNEGRTPLHVLAAADTSFKANAMQLLLDYGANPKIVDKQGRTPVQILLAGEWPWSGASESIDMLAKAGADLAAKDKEGRTPLHNFAQLGDGHPMFFAQGIADTFLAAKVDFNARDNDGNTPLHLASKSGARDVFNWMLENGADLDITNRSGETPRMLELKANNRNSRPRTPPFSAELDIFQAIREDKADAVKRILKADSQLANTPAYGQTPLRLAVTLERTNIVALLDTYNAKWDAPSAVMAGRGDILKKILRDQPTAISESAAGEGLLHLAAIRGNTDLIQQLLSANANPQELDLFGLSPLGRAQLISRTAVVNRLAAHGATNSFFDAIYLNDMQSVARFLAAEKSLANATNQARVTPVEIAAAADFTPLLKTLLKAGGRVNATPAPPRVTAPNIPPFNRPRPRMFTSPWTTSPLNLAVYYNRTNAVEALLQAGADVNQTDSHGFAPLHFAVLRNHPEILAQLLQHKANPDAASAELFPRSPMRHGPPVFRDAPETESPAGETPLHLAAMLGRTNLIEILLKSGVNVNATNAIARTPLDEAEQAGHTFHVGITPPAITKLMEPFGRFETPVSVSSVSPEIRKAGAAMILAAGGKHSEPFIAASSQPALSEASDGTAYHERGCSDYNAQRFNNALANFIKSRELGSEIQDYTYFRIWMTRARLGEKEAATRELVEYLEHRPAGKENDWPRQVGRYLAGQLAESNFLAAAESPVPRTTSEQQCEAWFYIGTKRLVEADRMGAIECFKKCLATHVQDFYEYNTATAELFFLEVENRQPTR